jgi:purine-binding chemotaxis protein CheW
VSVLHVLFRVGGADYVVAADDVLHLDSFTGATRVPGAPPYVAGLVQIRARVIPLIDLRLRFGIAATEPTPDSRVVVVKSGERSVGLLVDSAREVVKIPADQFRAAPQMFADDGQGFVKSVAQAGDRLLMLIDFQKVIGEERIDVE